MTQLPPKPSRSLSKGQKALVSTPISVDADADDDAPLILPSLPVVLPTTSRTQVETDSFVDPSDQVVIIVNPYSTGCVIGQEICKRGYHLVAVWTFGFDEAMKTHVPTSCGQMNYLAQISQEGNVESGMSSSASVDDVASSVLNAAEAHQKKVVACLAGGEAGVDFADQLSEHMGLLSNGTDIKNRRDKKAQQEIIRKHGLRSVRQAGGTKMEDVLGFLLSEPFPIVVKPTESAGSDGVKLCYTEQEAKDHFDVLMKSQMVNGGQCPAVLCQEFLRGTEYVIDHVSLDGRHVTTMLWAYDKRNANGAAFVYFGMKPVDIASPEAQILIPYVRGVLDALGIKHGPSHGEVMITDEGPCLVEMNCRAHGGDGAWRPLCKGLTGGYSQVEATVDAYLEPKQFAKLPDRPPSPYKVFGQEVMFVSYGRGKVKSTPGYDVIVNLPSFLCLETGIKPGVDVDYTIDLITGIGSVSLMHSDPTVLKRDIDFIRYMEKINGFFIFETKLENLKRPHGEQVVLDTIQSQGVDKERTHRRVFSSEGPTLIRRMSNDRPELRGPMMMKRVSTIDASKEAVVVVDPYSTGCCVVEEITKRGYRVIALWTKGFNVEMKTHVPLNVGSITYLKEVDEADSLQETSSFVYRAAGHYRVVACIAGGEAGVDLADALSEKMGLRTNGTRIPNKRDKKLQQELIKKLGLRSVRQAAGSEFADVEGFLHKETFPVVLKPVESAGSDGVKLCHNFDEAKEHFHVLMKSQMVNGGDCPAVLCQEFLRGKEYVIDQVSREGVHKCVMVWVYDKRPANGNAFVYFGCVPIDSSSTEAKILISYTKRVLDALDIKNGPSHAEIMMTNDGPCLVEMNCRAHGGDGNWRSLCVALNGGYSQVETTVDAYLENRAFQITPDLPPSPFKAFGQEVILVSFSRGKVKSTPGFELIQKLQSFVYLETGVRPGSLVDYTIDLFTGIGSVILMHLDETVLKNDVEAIRAMEKENHLFEYESPDVLFRTPSQFNVLKDVVVVDSDRPELY